MRQCAPRLSRRVHAEAATSSADVAMLRREILPVLASIAANDRTASARLSPSLTTPTCEVIMARRFFSVSGGIAQFRGVTDAVGRPAGEGTGLPPISSAIRAA